MPAGNSTVAAQLAAQWQTGTLVYGFEAELAHPGLDGEDSFTSATPLFRTTRLMTVAGYELGANVKLRGRIGVLMTPATTALGNETMCSITALDGLG